MGFDDLAKHMASRDRRKKLATLPANPDQIVADAAKADRRMSRTRDLILGPLLLVGGAVILLLYTLYLRDATDPTPRPDRPREEYFIYSIGLSVFAGGMVIVGFLQSIRGLRGRSR